MIPLYVLGKLDKFTTFNLKYKSNRDLLKWAWHYNPKGSFEPQIFTFTKNHKPQSLPWLRVGAALGTIRWLLTRLVPKFLVKKLRQAGYYSRRADTPNAYEFLEVDKIISSIS